VVVASTGPYANHLHFTPDNHTSTTSLNILQYGTSLWREVVQKNY